MEKYVIYSIKDKNGKDKTDEKSLSRLNLEVEILDLKIGRRGQFRYLCKYSMLITSLIKNISNDNINNIIQFETEKTIYSLKKYRVY